ncbi:hypothetical protein LAZ67_13003290 [Cordylochernes scorpioides]|uniref:HhH-GPD domain-containing protein n=1 Tax=Cordylochernes scorpioides TaxID=51811 RepID=A0ABY6L979_9ARAC|nr:hypothetical protein LAZ67_13003290 [Cordylochernes scorpioides]
MSGVKRAAHLTYKELWAVDGSGAEINVFLFLLRCLRFDDITTRKEQKKLDKLALIIEFVEAFVYNCKKLYTPGEYNAIDEKLIPFCGSICPTTLQNMGSKFIPLVMQEHFIPLILKYIVENNPMVHIKKSNSPDDIVKRLITPISGTSRNITTDNWYTSYKLSQDLLTEHKLTLVGTLKKKIKRKFLKYFCPIGIDQNIINTTLVSYVPKKSKAVLLLSTMHSTPIIDKESGFKLKPEIVTFYSLTKGGVDMVNQMCGTYSVGRRTNRWPLCLFFDLLNVAGIHSEIIFKSLNINSPRVPRRIFLKNISLQLFQDHLKIRSQLKNLPRSLHDLIILHCKKAESPELSYIYFLKLFKMINITIFCLPQIEMSVESEPKKRKRCYVCPSTKVTSIYFQKKDEEKNIPLKKRRHIAIKVDTANDKWEPPGWKETLENIRRMRSLKNAPVDTLGAHCCADRSADPKVSRFQTLVGLMLSSQTKDEVTHAAVQRLIQHGLTVDSILQTSEERVGELIYPVGFWKKKAQYLKAVCQLLKQKYDGDIPNTLEGLCQLPGGGAQDGTSGHGNSLEPDPGDSCRHTCPPHRGPAGLAPPATGLYTRGHTAAAGVLAPSGTLAGDKPPPGGVWPDSLPAPPPQMFRVPQQPDLPRSFFLSPTLTFLQSHLEFLFFFLILFFYF